MPKMPFKKGNIYAFKKGHIPFSKGTKGIIKPNITSFKKGLIPWNKGVKVIRLWESDIKKMDLNKFKDKIIIPSQEGVA